MVSGLLPVDSMVGLVLTVSGRPTVTSLVLFHQCEGREEGMFQRSWFVWRAAQMT